MLDNGFEKTNLFGGSRSGITFADGIVDGRSTPSEAVEDIELLPRDIAVALVIDFDVVKEPSHFVGSRIFFAEPLISSYGGGGVEPPAAGMLGVLQWLVLNFVSLLRGIMGFLRIFPLDEAECMRWASTIW